MSLEPDKSESLSDEQLEDLAGGTMDQNIKERDCSAMLGSLIQL
jgi:hypothetical protein